MWLSQGDHQIIWEKEKLCSPSPTLVTSGEDQEDLSAVLAASSRRSFQASWHGCGIPLSFSDEKCQVHLLWCGWPILVPDPPALPHRAVCAQGWESVRPFTLGTEAQGCRFLTPQRYPPAWPTSHLAQPKELSCRYEERKRQRRCFLGDRKFTHQSSHYWSASTRSDVAINHSIDEKPSQLHNSVAFSAVQAKISQSTFFCWYIFYSFSNSKPTQVENVKMKLRLSVWQQRLVLEVPGCFPNLFVAVRRFDCCRAPNT